jgi:hypothetical protein
MARRLTIAEVDIVRFGRREFFDEVWDYRPGDHATFLAPTGGGKTQIGFDALAATATPKLQAVVLVMKPKDPTVTRWAKAHGFETVRDWPPPAVRGIRNRVLGKQPPGWILWPPDTGNLEYDEIRQQSVFRRCLRMQYVAAKKHPNITFADEGYSLEKELGLAAEIRRAHTKGRSLGHGMWEASQRAAYIGMWAYQAQHLFIGFDPDEAAQDRYKEIGAGIDPAVVKAVLQSLGRFEFLYISREERAMCIVEAS